MPRPFPAEFRMRPVALVRAGKPITTAAVELGLSAAAIHNWARQDQIGRGERPGITTLESTELATAEKRIRQLETEVDILKVAAKLLGEDRPGPKDSPGSRRHGEGGLPGQCLLQASRCQQPRVLHIQEPRPVADSDATAVADRIDPGGSHGLAANLWFPTGARGTQPRNGRSGKRSEPSG